MALMQALQGPDGVIAPGVYDALTALLAEQAGFSAAYISGASVSYTLLGRPDLGFVSLSQLAEAVERMRQRVTIDLIVDADTGFGNALNVIHTTRMLERAGASAIQLEDQKMPKRCGHLGGKQLVTAAEMVGKVKAATDARTSEDTLIIARTDGIAVEGLNAALDRAMAYKEAGADILFVEAPQSAEDMTLIVNTFDGTIPLLANMVDGGDPAVHNASALHKAGYSLVITAGSLTRAMAFAADQLLHQLRKAGTTAACSEKMFSFAGLNQRIGLPEMLARSVSYASDAVEIQDQENK
ncbi:isocitrate lyase/PEP mutase family protein [uncultured Parasphingorhabdus sp.]|uniref:isocitrate lyase/PEP mutase family protein n=1 Tax=uncultured Parasphingorhabdus sp. TaxID=2709694 RepID=UPI002AA85AE3|nr:isocitrate lyase/PEP mutase family protein [uncultured Parasphingorhabdus sp.]